MRVRLPILTLALCAASAAQVPRERPAYSHPGWKPSPPQTAMPKSTLVVEQTRIDKARFPVIDAHFHGRFLRNAEEYRKLIAIMDQVGLAMIVNLDLGSGRDFDRNMELNAPYRDRIVPFARLDWKGVNDPGWTENMVRELERCFRAGAQGLKISKELGLDLRNQDGSFIQTDDPRLDPIWDLCARYNRPVIHHVCDQVGRFLPIGPENERYEAGVWRDSPADNYYGTGQPGFDEIHAHRDRMVEKHPKTVFILAHIGMMGFDLKKVGAMLDRYPNVMVDVSAAIQEVGRQPRAARRFFLAYQDRVLFGTDGVTDRKDDVDGFWRPHFRFFETEDEYFDHPAQMLSKLGAPLHGRWRIYGVGLPDDVLRKIYYGNAIRYLPAQRAAMEKYLAAYGRR